eukprot:757847-Hanusia_phi.AAC.4
MEQSQPRYNANRLIGNRNRFLNYKLAVQDVPKSLSVMRGGSVYDLEVMKGGRDISGDGGVRKMIISEGVHNEMPVNGDELFVYFNGSLAYLDNGTTIVGGKNISDWWCISRCGGERRVCARLSIRYDDERRFHAVSPFVRIGVRKYNQGDLGFGKVVTV